MTRLNLVCPRCKSRNVREWVKERFRIFDDDTYVMLNEVYKGQADIQNHYDAKCFCEDCQHRFRIRVNINVEATKIIYSGSEGEEEE